MCFFAFKRHPARSLFLAAALSFFWLLFGRSPDVLASPAAVADGVDCSIASSAMQYASNIRGLRTTRAVPCKLQNREDVERYLRATLKKKIPAERLRKEGRIFRLIGLVPKDYDYVNGLIKLYSDQLGGYYDPEREYYAMAEWIPAAMQM